GKELDDLKDLNEKIKSLGFQGLELKKSTFLGIFESYSDSHKPPKPAPKVEEKDVLLEDAGFSEDTETLKQSEIKLSSHLNELKDNTHKLEERLNELHQPKEVVKDQIFTSTLGQVIAYSKELKQLIDNINSLLAVCDIPDAETYK